MDDFSDTPPEAIMLMKMALGLIDASGGRVTPVGRHLNAAIEIATGRDDTKPVSGVDSVRGVSPQELD